MNYAMLVNGEIVFAPRKLRDGETIVYNPPEALLRQHGYKPTRETEAPETEEGFMAIPDWEETEEAVVRVWRIEPEGDLSAEEVLEILLGGAT